MGPWVCVCVEVLRVLRRGSVVRQLQHDGRAVSPDLWEGLTVHIENTYSATRRLPAYTVDRYSTVSTMIELHRYRTCLDGTVHTSDPTWMT